MLSITKYKDKEDSRWSFFNRSSDKANTTPILEKLAESFEKEIKMRLKQIDSSSENLLAAEALYSVIDNLTNIELAIKKTLRVKDLSSEEVLLVLDKQIEQTKAILQSEMISKSSRALAIGMRSLNLLFCTKQAVKQKFSIITPITLPQIAGYNEKIENEASQKLLSSAVNDIDKIPRLTISSTLLYQLHHSLFPAERMLVGAGRENGRDIEIDGIFDVTGKATSGYVKADANRLGRALIVMSETEKHFALWIHSHPGRGKGATHPSDTDLNQEAEWLKDYSPNLISAIIVEDRFIRFWGRALEQKLITIEVSGTGISLESKNESIYRLEF